MMSKKDVNKEWKDEININKGQWVKLLKDILVVREKDLELLKLIYASDDHMATASQLAEILNIEHHAPLNSQVGRLGKRIANKLNIEAPKQKKGNGYNWFNVPFWGIQTNKGYYWILRPELKEAMEELSKEGNIELITEVKLPDEIDSDNIEDLSEGVKKQVYVNRYERNMIARNRCINHYKSKCYICNFDFEKVYGEIGKDIIHVHHLKPLSDIRENYKVNPIKDLRPVCPNCHLILHKKNPPFTIDEVKKMIKNNR